MCWTGERVTLVWCGDDIGMLGGLCFVGGWWFFVDGVLLVNGGSGACRGGVVGTGAVGDFGGRGAAGGGGADGEWKILVGACTGDCWGARELNLAVNISSILRCHLLKSFLTF